MILKIICRLKQEGPLVDIFKNANTYLFSFCKLNMFFFSIIKQILLIQRFCKMLMNTHLWLIMFILIYYIKKLIFVFSDDAFNRSRMNVKSFIMMQTFIFSIKAVLFNFISDSWKKYSAAQMFSTLLMIRNDSWAAKISILEWFLKIMCWV